MLLFEKFFFMLVTATIIKDVMRELAKEVLIPGRLVHERK